MVVYVKYVKYRHGNVLSSYCCHGNVVSMNNVTTLEITESGHATGIIMDYAVVEFWR